MKHNYTIILALIISVLLSVSAFSQWVHVSGLGGGGTKGMAIKGTNIFIGTEMGVYKSTDNGASWTAVNNNLPETLIWDLYVYGNKLYACTGGVGFFRTTDDGANWDNLGLISENIRGCAENDSGIFAGTNDHGVFRSTDDGATWFQANNGILSTVIWSFLINGDAIFAGGPRLYRSMDNGANWENLTNGLPNPPLNVNAFTMIGSTIYIAMGGGVYSSDDNGDTWSNRGLNYVTVYAISSYGTNLFAGVSGTGVYLSTDGGSNWEFVSEGLPSEIYPQAFVYSGEKVFLSAWYEGLFERPLSELISAVEDTRNGVPTAFYLDQNYPNPFNPTTKIKYTVPSITLRQAQSDIRVTLKVYDILGNEIATLVNEEKPAGSYEVEFDGSGLTSGIYFYQLKVGSFVDTKKMVFMK